MSIMTKTGDDGSTSLWSGERIGKDDARVEAYGTIDELSAFLSEAAHSVEIASTRDALEGVQKDLFRIGAELASVAKPSADPLGGDDVLRIEKLVLGYESAIKIRGFVVPGTLERSAKLDVARTVARRAERRVLALSRSSAVSANLLAYLNRLSDLLFMLARAEEEKAGALRYRSN